MNVIEINGNLSEEKDFQVFYVRKVILEFKKQVGTRTNVWYD